MPGVLIAGMGLPGAGKSSVFGALADSLMRKSRKTRLYREPEESEWTDAVRNRECCGCITAMTWFRSIRVPNLYEAAKAREAGEIAMVDSYYDKLIHLYFENPAFDWLMPQGDPYRPIFAQLARLDFEILPDADCVITFTVNESRWKELVLGRGRSLDRTSNILESYGMQQSLVEASQSYCTGRKIPHVVFENSYPTTASAAIALSSRLMEIGVVQSE